MNESQDMVKESEKEYAGEDWVDAQQVAESTESETEALAEESVAEDEQPAGETLVEKYKKKHRKKVIAIVCSIVALVVVAAVVACMFVAGVFSPGTAAAKYGVLSYVDEEDVTEYIETYKEQMGYADASDEQWATFLAEYNLTPTRLRKSTIDQLVYNDIIRTKAAEYGQSVSDEELDEQIESMKESYAFGDDDAWASTLEAYGTDEDNLRDTYELTILTQKLYTAAVEMPEIDDESLKSYIESITASSSTTTKHTYCFKIEGLDEGSSTEHLGECQKYLKGLKKDGVSEETFEAYASAFCTDEDLAERGGANGWDIDTTSFSDTYLEQVEALEVGEISDVFADDDGYAFIWVDEEYELSSDSAEDLDDIPETLREYLRDCAAYVQWQADCEAWLALQLENENIIYFEMPSSVPYNVDMSLAQTDDSDTDEDADSSTDDSSSSDSSDENSESNDESEQ